MAFNPKLSDTAVNESVDTLCAMLNGGKLQIYAGTQPTDADTAISTQTLLGTMTFSSPAFGAAVSGVATANAIAQDNAADASGTATFFRAFKANGTTVVMDGSVDKVAPCDLQLNNNVITQGGTISVTSMTITQPAG